MTKRNIIIAIVGIVIIGLIIVLTVKKDAPKEEQVMCTMDARQCPDGSYVGRVGPSCEFAACPTVESKAAAKTTTVAPKAGTQTQTAPATTSSATGTASVSTTVVILPKPSAEVRYTDRGFIPENVSVKVGSVVSFINASNKAFWPASDNHPTHEVYPEFDAKTAIPTGGKFDFQFTKTGTWIYHNHLKPTEKGIIVVTE